MGAPLSPPDVELLLGDLAERLAELEGPAQVYVFGGAAIALINPARDSTRDVDAYFGQPAVDSAEVVAQLAREWGLDDGWLNFGAEGLLPPVAGADAFRPWRTVGDATIFVATVEALLAMKLRAARAKDQADIAFLLRVCGVTTVDAAEEIFEGFYPGDLLSPTALARVRAALDGDPS
jgi:hypothetical protein